MTQGFIVRPLCPFCSAPWTDDMIKVEDVSCSQGCDTCGYGGSASGTVKIHCEACEKLIYQKDFGE
jgi:hypothetical protein